MEVVDAVVLAAPGTGGGWDAAPAWASAPARTGRAVSEQTHSAALQNAQARK